MINISRKSLLSVAIMATATLMSSCSETAEDFMNDPDALHVEVIDNLVPGKSKMTRTAYNGFHTDFEEGDAIGVYAFNGNSFLSSNVKFTKQADGSWIPEKKVIYNPSYTYYAYFPYRVETYTPSTSDGDEEEKFANFITDSRNYFWKANQSSKDNFTASNLMLSTGALKSNRTVKFTMKHERSLVVVGSVKNKWHYFYDPSTEYDITPVFSGNIPYQSNNSAYFLMKPNTETTVMGMKVRASAGKYMVSDSIIIMGTPSYSYSTSSDGKTWSDYESSKPEGIKDIYVSNEGETLKFSVDVLNEEVKRPVTDVDLSMVNNDGTPRSLRETANCYLIHGPGTYRLPLVYGNAIHNGKGNPSAYRSDKKSNYAKQYLVNHEDNPVYTGNDASDPWIKNHNISVDGAKLIWQDVKGLISNPNISGDYLTFTVNKETYAPGNAVIAATSNGTVVWSWHIWATNNTLKESELSSVNTGSYIYKVAPVDVGQTSSLVNGGNYCKIKIKSNGMSFILDLKKRLMNRTKIFSPYYQWGRKDPQLPNTECYDINGNVISLQTSYRGVQIGETIKNPNIFYSGKGTVYFSDHDDFCCNYWNINDIGEYDVDSSNKTMATEKTIYDPCPPDYCLPTIYLFRFLENSGVVSRIENGGLLYVLDEKSSVSKELEFPILGYRRYEDGSISGTNYAKYWSASPRNDEEAYDPTITRSYSSFLNDRFGSYITTSCCVRPVLEE